MSDSLYSFCSFKQQLSLLLLLLLYEYTVGSGSQYELGITTLKLRYYGVRTPILRWQQQTAEVEDGGGVPHVDP